MVRVPFPLTDARLPRRQTQIVGFDLAESIATIVRNRIGTDLLGRRYAVIALLT
jgi:hypothetical protein